MSDLVLDLWESVESETHTWYRALQWLGSGRNAETYLVLATSGDFKGTLFALKLFKRLSVPDRRARFLNEVEFLRRCEHPAVMRVFDSGLYREKFPFVVAEYLPRTLADAIRTGVSNVEKISYALQLLSALDYLDRRTVVHRDIKPDNIFVKGPSCVLGDFGLMKRLAVDDPEDRLALTDSQGPLMPLNYRTPDLVAYGTGGTPLTTKSDVFQLGLVLAELFTGVNPERDARDHWAPVELAPLGTVPGAMGEMVAGLIQAMLQDDSIARPSAANLFDAWRGLFFDAAERLNALEGRIY